MFRGCPTTGRMSHRFDPVTHRCVCGRWQNGYKPKTEPARPRAECQICERTQALDSAGLLGHHGYKRPGWGFITGDCMGVHHKPFPATDALEKYLSALRDYVGKCLANLRKLPTLTEWEYRYTVRTGPGQKETRTRTIRKGDDYQYDAAARQSFPAFDSCISSARLNLESEIKFAEGDAARVVKRIEEGKRLAG